MEIMKKILFVLCMGVAVVSCSSDDEHSVPATDITDLALTSNPGNIELTWEYPEEDNNNRYIEICYYDPAKKKNVRKAVSAFNNSYTVKDTRRKYGEYKFSVQPFSTTFTPGTIQEISGVSEVAPIIESYTSEELTILPQDVHIEGLLTGTASDLMDKNL